MDAKTIFLILIVYQSLMITESCKKHKTCHECIMDPSVCIWCTSSDKKFDIEPRCRLEGTYEPDWCAGALDITDKISHAKLSLNTNFSASVQIKPQQYKVSLRPGKLANFTFSFQEAKDYPVDMYMLLDASRTMEIVKNDLVSHSERIYKTMQSMTQNVNMGFGTYIDKNTAPYTLKPKLNLSYSFRNNLNLTSDYTKFEAVVRSTTFGENFDSPEGGFDALAQVMACNVNWRNNSRKLIVFLTDSSHHVVGDGRNAGIFKPFDGKCHTDERGVYTKELEMDYPSLTDINTLAIKNEVIIIFTLKEEGKETLYLKLKDAIRGSKMAILTNNNIETQLKESYKEISTNIKLEAGIPLAHKNNYEITFDPDCTKVTDTADCKVETGERRDFKGTITLKEYYGKDTEEITIKVQGIKEELKLSVNVIKCACEAHEVTSSEHCFGQKLQCGTCICDQSTYGNRCMCNRDKAANNDTGDTLCNNPNGSGLCSGQGRCECGLCICKDIYHFGQFCDCDRRRCPGYEATGHGQRLECGGHGKCSCSGDSVSMEVCTCERGFSHKPGAEYLGCVCPDATDLCTNQISNTICSNHGKCICNSCECDDIASWDKRMEQDRLCQLKPNPDSHSLQCDVIRTCVLCNLDSEICDNECTGIHLQKKYDVLPDDYIKSNGWSLCDSQKVGMGCYTKFMYKYDDKNYRVLLQMQEITDCAESHYMYGGILLLTLLLVGILTILAWKCLTRYQDLKEYRNFEATHKDVLNAPCQNPLFEEPTTTIRNPTFKKSISD